MSPSGSPSLFLLKVVACHTGAFHRQADEPAEQQVVADLFHQLPLGGHRVERLQQQSAQQLLGRDAAPADPGLKPVELEREHVYTARISCSG